MANIIKFENDEQFLNHVFDSIMNGKKCSFIESYGDYSEVYEEENDVNNYFLSDEFTIHSLAHFLLDSFEEDILIKEMGYDTIEDGGEEIPYKFMRAVWDAE